MNIRRKAGRWLMGGPQRRRAYETINRQLPRVLGDRIRSGPAAGLRFSGGDTVGYLLGVSEPAVQEAMVANLRLGSVFYDVGSHAGFHTILGCRLVGPSGQVHAFEPIRANVSVLHANLDRNGMCNATVHAVALADRSGQARMAMGERHITAAFDPAGETIVQTVRADDLGLPPPHLVKIDVEGAEARVLHGMSRILTEDRPVLLVEIHNAECGTVVTDLLRAHGYDVETLNDDGMPHVIARPRCRQ